MPERPFLCTPWIWLTDSALNSISEEAELLFRRLAQNVDKHWRLAVDEHDPAQTIRCRCFEPMKRFRQWSTPRIDRCLGELLASGCVQRLSTDGRFWLQVAERLRYVKGHDPTAMPAPPEQAELIMATPLLLPDPGGGNGKRERVEQRRSERVHDPEVRSKQPAKVTGSLDPPRLLALDAEEGLLAEISICFGMREVVANGGMWRTRMRSSEVSLRAIRNAIEDYKVRTPEQRAAIKNRGAWATDRYERNLVEIETAQRNAA
jgi:hypothetical protein